MFTGIIESTGEIVEIESTGTNKTYTVKATFPDDIYIDQSIAHNGVCLTVVSISADTYKVTAIKETLERSNIGLLQIGDRVNLERAVSGHTLMDGHIVQGHVDDVATCTHVTDVDGSWYFTFKIDADKSPLVVDKGSICINGVSLTVIKPTQDSFQVAIIPYTYEHTTFRSLSPGDTVNIEWDIIGKYVLRYMERVNS